MTSIFPTALGAAAKRKLTPQYKAELKWPEKSRARRLVRDAIKRGTLSRPTTCAECGENPGTGTDGRSLIHAHHVNGYDKPLDVQWLCAACHAKHDPRPCGSNNGQSVLTLEDVQTILKELSEGATMRGLARLYNVDFRTIHRIKIGVCWGQTLAAAQNGGDLPAPPMGK